MKKYIILSFLFTALPSLGMEDSHKIIRCILQEIQAITDLIAPQLEEALYGEQPAIANNQYKDKTAHIKKDNSIGSKEKKYIAQREPIVRATLETRFLCSMNNKRTPVIACVFSGGGYRAMLCALGSLKGLEQEGLLNCTMYNVALSGSTWALAPWLSSGMPLKKITEYIHECAQKRLYKMTSQEKLLLANMIAVKKLSHQPITLVDLYGGLLGNRLLECFQNERHVTYLSQQTSSIDQGQLPYPIYTATSGNKEDDHSWYTFTPDKVSNITYGISIPTYGCGRYYDTNQSTNTVPALPLSVLLGTWGSAPAANWNEIIDALENSESEYTLALELLKQLIKPIGHDRPIPIELELPTFMAGTDTPLSSPQHLQIVDAGLKINLPYPAVSGICPERRADIMLFFDNSAGELGEELKKCAEYAQQNQLPFPHITTENINKKTLHIFKSDDPSVPLVLYLPGVSNKKQWEKYQNNPEFEKYNLSGFDLEKETNEGFCRTCYLRYSKEHSRLVTNQTEFNLRVNRDEIVSAIKEKIDIM